MKKSCLLILSICGWSLLSGCNAGSSTPPPHQVTYTIGGTVVNLVGTDLVLYDNGGDRLPLNANGNFTFPTSVASGGAFAVTVHTQPSAPAQTCGVTNGSGSVSANVTNVQINCGHNEWAWMSGAKVINQGGIYGTQGTPSATNVPGARYSHALSWADPSGNLWLFGGFAIDSTGVPTGARDINDLWSYNIRSGQWTWMSGSNLVEQKGTYGTQGTAASANVPGARELAVSWTDTSGNLWLFGGFAVDSTGAGNDINDLWKYTISSGQWTWMSGSNVGGQAGTYGVQGTASTTNVPGARENAVSWFDRSGNLWLFGGLGFVPGGANGPNELNDLWKYNISSGQWTWVSGSSVVNQQGTYGAQGTVASANVPGGRDSAVSWIDTSGNLWLFGGHGLDSTGNPGEMNDLWKYNINSDEWTWMSGSTLNNLAPSGTYGTQGMLAPTNVPGVRYGAPSWVDVSGNLWLFGGVNNVSGLNDLWMFMP